MIHNPLVNCLYLDLASHNGLIACSDGNAVLAQESCDHKVGDDELLPLIEEVLQKARAHIHGRHVPSARVYDDVTHIACVIGPGGFTSLRVAVTCANVLADQLHIPIAGVHLFDVWRAKVMTDQKKEVRKFIWLHSTKKEELFARTFGDSTWSEAAHLSIDDFSRQVPHNLPWTGELTPEHRELVDRLGLPTLEITNGDWLPTLLAGLVYSKTGLVPWYGRGY